MGGYIMLTGASLGPEHLPWVSEGAASPGQAWGGASSLAWPGCFVPGHLPTFQPAPVLLHLACDGKRSLLGKIAGSYEDKFATVRACMMFIMSFPGKKMLFMGTEYAAFSEWCESRPLEWFMLEYESH